LKFLIYVILRSSNIREIQELRNISEMLNSLREGKASGHFLPCGQHASGAENCRRRASGGCRFFKKIKKRKKYFFCPAGGVLAAIFLAPWQRASGMMTSCDRRLK
jgi:hypothetical protein